MRKHLFVSLLLILLLSTQFLAMDFLSANRVRAQNQENYSLNILGITWSKSILNVLLITPSNASWWNPIFLNSTLRAIGQWNDAFSYFSSNYTSYSYMSAVRLWPTVSNQSLSGFDIYISWGIRSQNASNEIGEDISSSLEKVSTTANITLAAEASHGNPLSDIDMQNVALHELGHSLGLGGTDTLSGDVMYCIYTLLSPPRLVSTLDMYALSAVFAWMQQNASEFYPVNAWLQSSPVTMPSNIPYTSLSVSSQNAAPQTIASNPVIETLILMLEILVHPEFLVFIVLFAVFLIILALYPKKRGRTNKAHVFAQSPDSSPKTIDILTSNI